MKVKTIFLSIIFSCFSALIISYGLAEEIFLFSKPLSGVYLMKGDEEELIIHRQGSHIAPRLSPDGERILFHSTQGGKIGIWLTDLYGKEMERLCDGDQANWSHDGKRIIFRREGKIMERDVASGIERVITPQDWSSCEFPSYFPDGRAIFVSNGKIFLIDSDNKTPPELLVEGDIRSAPRCSPDGKHIAYQNGSHIYLMDLGNRKACQLTTAGGVQSWPIWSYDGLSICYCQSSGTFDGPWDICSVAIDSPQNVALVMRDVEISPDWRGSSPSVIHKIELKGNSASLWQVGESLAKKDSWKILPVDNEYKIEGEIAVENDWITFFLSSRENKLLIFTKEIDPSKRAEVELKLINQKDKAASQIESISASGSDGESVILKASFRSAEGDVTKAIFTIPRSKPFVGIKPVENLDRVYIKRSARLALLPDRFADDLIFDPHKDSMPRILLPYMPFLVGLPDDNSMFMVITPSDKQEMWLIKEEDSFAGVEVLTEATDIFISLLSGRDLWYKTEVTHDPDSNRWKMDWSKPFLAQWRVAVAAKGKYYSMMWDEEALNKLTGSSLHMEGEFSGNPELSIMYLYGRSWNTPLNVITPVDILQDALGTEKLGDILDIEGIRAYRTAEKRVPLHSFLTSQENRLWPEGHPGWPQVLDFSPIYQLLVRMRMVDRKGVESTTAHLCDEILNSLKGLDSRIEEYEGFFAGLENLSVEQAASPLKLKESIENLRSETANLPITEIQAVSDSAEAIKKCLGTGDELWDRGEFDEFREVSESALLERQEILTEYRNFVKQLRDNAGIAISENPEVRDIAEKLRSFTHNILRNRYYLEGDWRGEKPLQ